MNNYFLQLRKRLSTALPQRNKKFVGLKTHDGGYKARLRFRVAGNAPKRRILSSRAEVNADEHVFSQKRVFIYTARPTWYSNFTMTQRLGKT